MCMRVTTNSQTYSLNMYSVLHGESNTGQASPRTPTQRTFQAQEAVQPQLNQTILQPDTPAQKANYSYKRSHPTPHEAVSRTVCDNVYLNNNAHHAQHALPLPNPCTARAISQRSSSLYTTPLYPVSPSIWLLCWPGWLLYKCTGFTCHV